MAKTIKLNNVFSNFIYQSLYQVFMFVIPLIIAPYLTRVLSSGPLGTYAFINSICLYFIYFCNLGISKHGQRIIAASKNDSHRLRVNFWSLYFLHTIVSIFVLTIYIICSSLFFTENTNLYLINIMYVLSALFDVTWFFYGLEKFKGVALKNGILKLCECILIFCFVKSPEDLRIYISITSSSALLGQIILIPGVIKIVKPIRFSFNDVKRHIKPMLVLFLAVLASALYTIFDKTLLGIMTTKDNVAFYEYSDKIIAIPKMLLLVISTIMFPRTCAVVNEQNKEKQKEYMLTSLLLITMGSCAFIFGILSVINKFVILYYGEDFITCANIIMCMSPLIYIVMIGEIFRSQYLIPLKLDVYYTSGIAMSALFNIVLSFSLIPVLGIYGAVIGTLCAELFNTCFEIWCARKLINIKYLFKFLFPFVCCGLIMFGVVYSIDYFTSTNWLWLILEVLIGAVVYILLAIVACKLFYNINILNYLKCLKNETIKKERR